MKKYICFILLILASSAFAQAEPAADPSIVQTVTAALAAAATKNIMPQALMWLGSFAALQLIISNISLLKSGSDITAVIGKVAMSLGWIAICLFILDKGPNFIDEVGNQILDKYFSGVPGPGSIIAATVALCTTLLAGISIVGVSIVGNGNSSLAMLMVYILITVFIIGIYLATKVAMLHLELGIIVMIAPLSFAFLGLNSMRDQGTAPFKSLISLIYRIIILGVICSAFGNVIDVAGTNLKDFKIQDPVEWVNGVSSILSMLAAFPMLAYLCFKSDSIAASLASGSTNMGAGDAASAASIGSAVGAAVASGGAAVAGVASKVSPMSDVLKNMMGANGSISNAGAGGIGRPQVGSPPTPPPSMSKGSGLPVDKHGSPLPPTPYVANPYKPEDEILGKNRSGGVMSPPGASGRSSSIPSQASGEVASSAKEATGSAPSTSNEGASPGADSPGSAANAGMAGAGRSMDENFDRLAETLNRQNSGGKKPSLMDHVAQEKASTSISINTHHSD